jgi:hypothetical protein
MKKINVRVATNPLMRKSHVHDEESKVKKLQRKTLLEDLIYNNPIENLKGICNGNV